MSNRRVPHWNHRPRARSVQLTAEYLKTPDYQDDSRSISSRRSCPQSPILRRGSHRPEPSIYRGRRVEFPRRLGKDLRYRSAACMPNCRQTCTQPTHLMVASGMRDHPERQPGPRGVGVSSPPLIRLSASAFSEREFRGRICRLPARDTPSAAREPRRSLQTRRTVRQPTDQGAGAENLLGAIGSAPAHAPSRPASRAPPGGSKKHPRRRRSATGRGIAAIPPPHPTHACSDLPGRDLRI